MKESTKNIFKLHGWRLDHAIHNYIYFAQYDRYVDYFLKAGRLVSDKLGGLFFSAPLFKWVFDRYHAKVITESDAVKILTLDRDLVLGPDTTERIIPFRLANKIILKEPEYIAAMDCPCRLSRENPCRPVNVCIAVGRTTAEFWLDHGEKYHVRKITQEEALEIIRSARARGEITTAWFKVETGARTGVLCSCCKCCCGGLEGMRLARQVKGGEGLSNIIPSGYVVEYNQNECDTCGECVKVCMFNALQQDENGYPVYNKNACMGCGLCEEKCPQGARKMVLDPSVGYPLDLDLARERLGRCGD